MSIPADHAELAERWGRGLAGDWAALAELASPDMRVWHSSDGQWLDRDESTARMEHAAAGAPPAFGRVSTFVTEHGFVVQATLDGPDGATHVVQLLTVEDGRVVACEEYLAPTMSRPE
jgi:ketosteroid isomerase-like protein